MSQDIFVVIEHLKGQVADISYIMVAAGRVLAQGSGGNVVGILLGHNSQELAGDLAVDQVLYLDDPAFTDFTPDTYLATMSGLIDEQKPRVVLLGNTTVGADVASGLSARLGLPVVSQCQSLSSEGGELIYTSQICAGKIMAEGKLPDTTTILTVVPGGYKPEEGKSTQEPEVVSTPVPALGESKVKMLEYIEPEAADVDITKEQILISVGRGLQNQDDIELLEELADALGGVISASRPLVDQGWLATSRMVGKSGQVVKPKLYLAMGISGAPEHVEAITDSECIIAINTDPSAPIFDLAKYGADIDMLDLVEVLIEKVEESKG
jgi:electron transfer flavoprotein alpha subunit